MSLAGEPFERRRGAYEISTDPARLDLDTVHDFLSNRSYWAAGITRERLRRAIAGSIPFGLYADGTQAGFARVVTDRTTFAWLADVFVLEAHRGKGLGVWLVETAMAHPDLRDLRQWQLGTADAHGLYERFGFASPADPRGILQLRREERDVHSPWPQASPESRAPGQG